MTRILTALLMVFCISACGDDSSPPPPVRDATVLDLTIDTADAPLVGDPVTLSLTNVPTLSDSHTYEAWLFDGVMMVRSIGRFNIASDGKPDSELRTESDARSIANRVVITIEPQEGDTPDPSATRILAGDLSSGTAELTLSHTLALGTNLMSGTGSFVNKTYTSASPLDEFAGIWYLTPGPTLADATSSLSLPRLPPGWIYEGWIFNQNTEEMRSTGRFVDGEGPDSDGPGPGSEMPPTAVPPFPGQDFIDTQPVLIMNHSAWISVEPDPDTSSEIFSLVPFGADISMTQRLSANQAPRHTIPRGMISLP